MRLFLEKGYENTTVQDIVDHLGGLSKGAVYHHFKSKEDIFIAACDYLFSQDPTNEWALIRDDAALTATEKMRNLFLSSMRNRSEAAFRDIAAVQTGTPRFLVSKLKRTVEVTAPAYIQPIFEQAVAEGTLQTDFPKELAQVILLLLNVWMDAGAFPASDTDYLRKLLFMVELCGKYGIQDCVSDELAESIETNIIQSYNQKFKGEE